MQYLVIHFLRDSLVQVVQPKRQDIPIGDIPAQTRFWSMSKHSNYPPHSRLTPEVGEDQYETTRIDGPLYKLSKRVLKPLKNKRLLMIWKLTNLKKRFQKVRKKKNSRTPELKRMLFNQDRVSLKRVRVIRGYNQMRRRNEINQEGRDFMVSRGGRDSGELAARLQVQEQEELTIEERSKMFVELLDKRKKHFARIRAEEQRRKPPTKAQKRSQMSTSLKHMAGYKQNQLKNENYDEIQKLFDKAMTRVNMFLDMDTELVKESSKKAEMVQESSSKRVGEGLESDNSKKQKLDENVEVKVDDEAETKKHMEIVSDDEVAIDAIPLATKPPIINIDREDLETLWKLVKAKHRNTRPEEAYERVLWGDLKLMFEPDVEISAAGIKVNAGGYNC
ncbi:hypothetical protein Tco_1219120 [Tanacetum coccineum]